MTDKEVMDEFNKILQSPEFNVTMQEMFTPETIEYYNSVVLALHNEPEKSTKEYKNCLDAMVELSLESPMPIFFIVAMREMIVGKLARRYNNLYSGLTGKKKRGQSKKSKQDEGK